MTTTNTMLTEPEIDRLLIDTSCMDDVQTIHYIFEQGYDQAIKDMEFFDNAGMLIT